MTTQPPILNSDSSRSEPPALWRVPAPRQFDLLIPWWSKVLLMIVITIVAYNWWDQPVASWALQHRDEIRHGELTVSGKLYKTGGDIRREMAMLEQFGQWASSVIIIACVMFLDKQGKRKALAIAIGCLATVMVCYTLKDCIGRTRPGVFNGDAMTGEWLVAGPRAGFNLGSAYNSFPSAHTTGAFALATGLSWFYPRGRAIFFGLATFTAGMRVIVAMHYISDVTAGILLAVLISRLTLQANLAGRFIAKLPAIVQRKVFGDWPEDPRVGQ